MLSVECPHCKKWYSHSELLSYSTFGSSECWSDGKCVNNNLSEYSFMPFSKCEKCNNFFWFDDCRKIADYEISSYLNSNDVEPENLILIVDFLKDNPEFKIKGNLDVSLDYPHVYYWENMPKYIIPDYISILEKSNNLNRDREIYIRTKLSQHINDFVRNSQNSLKLHIKYSRSIKSFFNFKHLKSHIKFSFNNKKLYKEYEQLRTINLMRLSELYQETIDYEDSKMSLIEIERELGNFEKAKFIINGLDRIDKQHNKNFVESSLKYVLKNSAKIFKIR